MAYNFKNLNEVEMQDKPTENTTVMAFESGNPRQIPAGEFGGKGLVVDLSGYTLSETGTIIEDMSYDPIYEAITAGQNVVFKIRNENIYCFVPYIYSFVVPNNCFLVGLSSGAVMFDIMFRNGSYHTTA